MALSLAAARGVLSLMNAPGGGSCHRFAGSGYRLEVGHRMPAYGGLVHAGSVLGRPNRDRMLLSNRVRAETLVPASATTISPLAWNTGACGSLT